MTARSSSGVPMGDSASKRTAAGRRARSAPENCWRLPWRSTVTAARVRRSWNAAQFVASRSTARCASAERSSRGVRSGVAQAATATTRARLLRNLRALTLQAAEVVPHVVDLGLHPRGLRIELERALPGGQGVLVQAGLRVGVAQMIEDHRVVLGPLDRALQLPHRLGVPP